MRSASVTCCVGLWLLVAGCVSSSPAPLYTPPVPAPQFYVDGDSQRRIAYHDSDPQATKRAVVLIHGLGGGSIAWGGLLDDMSAYRLIRVDLLGHGDSSAPADFDYSMAAQAECIRRLLDTLELDHYVVAGASYG